MKPGYHRILVFVTFLLLLGTAGLTWLVIRQARQQQAMGIDLAEINHIRYGLLNVDEWAEKVASIITAKIEEFEITPENRETIQTNVENILYRLIDEVEELMKERTSGQFSGVKRWVASFAVDFEQLRDSVPSFAGAVIEELNRPENRTELKAFILEKLEVYISGTVNRDRMELLATLLDKYGCEDKPACRDMLSAETRALQEENTRYSILMLIGVLLIFTINMLLRGDFTPRQVPILILAALCLLLVGITTPMIQMEARIDTLAFKLVGEDLVFQDQVLFFQSKSITDVVRILMSEGTIQMIFVAVLIFLFSIVFPSLKLISSYLYYHDFGGLRKNGLIRFFVIKSGKWSMADVMVVALFMAYIGFNGVIGSQLDSLSNATVNVEILTTNGTRLQGGFFIFLFFCLASLFLSEALTRRLPESKS